MSGEIEVILKADGLWTNPNELTTAEGALTRADNLVSLRPGLIETRRGFEPFADVQLSGNVNVMAVYQDRLIVHYGADKLARYTTDGARTDYTGTYLAPTGYRMRMFVDQGNLYFTTSKGLYVLETLTGVPVRAGLTAPVVMADPAPYTGGTWLPIGYTVGFRAVVGYINPSGRQVLSAPSDSRQYTNAELGTRGVTIGFGCVGALTTSHFVQIHRTRSTPNASPGDEYYLVLERFLTTDEANQGIISFNDVVPDELLGPPLYTNPSQETMIQANEPPPLAKTMCPFASSMVFANTKSIHRKIIRLLSPPREGDTITIDGVTYTAWATPVSTFSYQTVTTGTVSQRIRNTAFNLCRHINGGNAAPRGNVIARYISGPFDAPGQILLERPDVSFGSFSLQGDVQTSSKSSVTRTSNVVTANMSTNHGLTPGDQVFIVSSDGAFLGGTFTVQTTPDADTFTYNQTAANGTHSGTFTVKRTSPTGGELWNPQLPPSGTSLTSSDDTALNRIILSKPNAPEAAPLTNSYPTGGLSNDVVHMTRLASSLFVFKKTEGLWKATGDALSGLNMSLFDSTVELVSPETVCSLDNTIFCLTRKGVVRISEAGVSEPISLAIEDQILGLYGTALATVQTVAHATAYESEGLYILYLPTIPGDTVANQAFVYSVRSGGWTRWTKPASALLVHEDDDKLYLGTTAAGISVERKLRDPSDHQDEAGEAIRVDVTWRPIIGGSPATQKRWREVDILLQDDTTNELTIRYATDISVTLAPLAARLPISLEGGNGAESSVLLTTSGIGTGIMRAPVPLDRCRSSRLVISLYHEAAGERMSCAGLAILLRTVSARSRR